MHVHERAGFATGSTDAKRPGTASVSLLPVSRFYTFSAASVKCRRCAPIHVTPLWMPTQRSHPAVGEVGVRATLAPPLPLDNGAANPALPPTCPAPLSMSPVAYAGSTVALDISAMIPTRPLWWDAAASLLPGGSGRWGFALTPPTQQQPSSTLPSTQPWHPARLQVLVQSESLSNY